MDAERVAHRVHTLCSTIEALGQELQEAHATIDLMAQTALDREQEIARLREELADATMAERARCLNVISGYVLKSRVKPFGAVGQALAFVMDEMKGSDND